MARGNNKRFLAADFFGQVFGIRLQTKHPWSVLIVFLPQAPIMGGRSNVAEPQRQGHVEEDNIAAPSLSSHQPITGGQGRPVTTMTSESKQTQSGGGESSQLQPQAVFGYCLMPGLRGIPMEDFHVAEVREIDGEEVCASKRQCTRHRSISSSFVGEDHAFY